MGKKHLAEGHCTTNGLHPRFRCVFIDVYSRQRTCPGGSVVKNLRAVQETQEIWVQSLGWEDPLEKEIATHSSILAWEIPWTQEPGRL